MYHTHILILWFDYNILFYDTYDMHSMHHSSYTCVPSYPLIVNLHAQRTYSLSIYIYFVHISFFISVRGRNIHSP